MFNYRSPTRVIAGVKAVDELGKEIKRMDLKKVLIVTDPGIEKAGILNRVLGILGTESIETFVFNEVEPNPKDSTIVKGAEYSKERKIDVLLGLGGGSPIDCAKSIAAMSTNSGPIEKYCADLDLFESAPLPIIAIPTTAGTGSEVTNASMIIDSAHSKKIAMLGWSIAPRFAILDPELTLSLPPKLTAQTGIDALTHAIESYISKGFPGNENNPITEGISLEAIKLITANIREAYRNGANIEARYNMLIGSCMAAMSFTNVLLGVVHSMGHAISGLYDIPHGLSMAVCLPYGIEYNLQAAAKKYKIIAQIMGKDISGLSDLNAANLLIEAIKELLEDLDIKDNFQTLGVKREDIPELARQAVSDNCTFTNPRPLSSDDFINLYQKAYNKV